MEWANSRMIRKGGGIVIELLRAAESGGDETACKASFALIKRPLISGKSDKALGQSISPPHIKLCSLATHRILRGVPIRFGAYPLGNGKVA
jgi:hypothetical protein